MNTRRKIEEAFGLDSPPREPLVEKEYLDARAQGDEGATAFFAGKRWNELNARGLRYHEAAMYMFTPEAHRYYLPAFMILSLDDLKAADVIPENMLFHFSLHDDPFWWERIRALTPAQCDAVAEFFRELENDFSRSQVEAAIHGLERAKQHS